MVDDDQQAEQPNETALEAEPDQAAAAEAAHQDTAATLLQITTTAV